MTESCEGQQGGPGRPPGAPSRANEENEEALIQSAQAGDAPALEALVRGHYGRVYGCAFRLVGNHEDAEDLAQECFVKAQRGLGWFRGEGEFGGWLRRILVHLARDRFRREGRRPEERSIEPLDLPAPGGPTSEVRRREFTRLLDETLRRLPDHLRIPLVLRTLEGLDYEAIAQATGVTVGTARTQVMKARKALQRLMEVHLPEGQA